MKDKKEHYEKVLKEHTDKVFTQPTKGSTMINLISYIQSLFKLKALLDISVSGRVVYIECATEEQAEKLVDLINNLSPGNEEE